MFLIWSAELVSILEKFWYTVFIRNLMNKWWFFICYNLYATFRIIDEIVYETPIAQIIFLFKNVLNIFAFTIQIMVFYILSVIGLKCVKLIKHRYFFILYKCRRIGFNNIYFNKFTICLCIFSIPVFAIVLYSSNMSISCRV